MRVFVVLLVVLIFCSVLWAHYPEGEVYEVVYIPDDRLPKIDGDLSDWDWVPQKYVFKARFVNDPPSEKFENEIFEHHITGSEGYAERWSFNPRRLIIGWNEKTNKLYFAAEVFDDRYVVDKETSWIGDYFDIQVDADHGGEDYWFGYDSKETGAKAQAYVMAMPPDGSTFLKIFSQATWVLSYPWSEYAGKVQGDPGGYTMLYEICITPFDNLNPDGPDKSLV